MQKNIIVVDENVCRSLVRLGLGANETSKKVKKILFAPRYLKYLGGDQVHYCPTTVIYF
jgi:hypothetical protein